MKRHILFCLLIVTVALPFAQTSAARYDSPYLHRYDNPVEPDTTKLIYPVPTFSNNPMENLYNQSPLYLKDPQNFSTEVIYDPLTRQYTFKRRIGDFYYDTPVTMTENEFLEYQSKKGVMEYWKERRNQNSRSTTNGTSIIPPIYIGGKAFAPSESSTASAMTHR